MPAFEADALISMFENASSSGSARLQKAVTEATLAALRGRELTLANIRSSLDAVAKAVTAGGLNSVPASKHFNDQAERYATGNLRDVYFYREDLKGHTEREYHPGEVKSEQ